METNIMKRYFELRDSDMPEFYEIEVIGNVHIIRSGTIGTEGETKTIEYSSEEESLEFAYIEVEGLLACDFIEVLEEKQNNNKTKEGEIVMKNILNFNNTSVCQYFFLRLKLREIV